MSKEHHVIYVPGLDDENQLNEFLINRWHGYGVIPHLHRVGWYNQDNNFTSKFKRLITTINEFLDQGNTVSLVGCSAGGSMVLNALLEQPKINAVVNLCGRLRTGKNVFPTLALAAKQSPSFKESVLLFEHKEPQMTNKERKKVLNLIPFWDEVVPKSTVSLNGARNQTLPMVEHVVSGILGITIFAPTIIRFIKEKAIML